MADAKTIIRRRWALGAGLVLTGAATAVPLAAGPAAAASCSPGTPAANCSMSGSFGLTGGTLGVASAASLSWASTLSGYDAAAVDAAHTTYTVDDPTGTGAGWDVTAAVTQFTTGSITLANAGTFSTTGSSSSATATTAPSAACAASATCVVPTESSVTYPVAITTAAASPTPVKVYNAAINTGMGAITIGATTPAGWWVSVPAKASAGTYTTTITLAIASGP